MAGHVVELPSSSSMGDFGEDLFERFVEKLMPDPVLDYSRIPVSKKQGVKTPDFIVSLKCGCSPLAVEVKTMGPRRTELEYAAGRAKVINRMESVEKLRHLIGDANAQLIGRKGPGILVVMTGPDDRAILAAGSGLSAIDMAMQGNHVANFLVPRDPRGPNRLSHWSRDEEGARTKPDLNVAISTVGLLERQWHSGDPWELRLFGLRNGHAKFPICEHFKHESIHFAIDDVSLSSES